MAYTFRGFIYFNILRITQPYENLIERYFILNNLEASDLMDCEISKNSNSYAIDAKIMIHTDKFDSVFSYYKNLTKKNDYFDSGLFKKSSISEESFDYYIFTAVTVNLLGDNTQGSRYIIVSKPVNEKREIYLSINMIGWNGW